MTFSAYRIRISLTLAGSSACIYFSFWSFCFYFKIAAENSQKHTQTQSCRRGEFSVSFDCARKLWFFYKYFVFAQSALANPLDDVACLPFFGTFFNIISFHIIFFPQSLSFCALLFCSLLLLLELPICGVLICYPVADRSFFLPSFSPGPWCWFAALGYGCGWYTLLCPNPLGSAQNEALKTMRFLASGDVVVVGVYQINIFEIYNK